MAKLPDQKRISPEEFPDQEFMPRLLSPINRFFENVVRALNRGLTFKENMAGDLRTVVIDGTFPVDIKWTAPQPPVSAWIGRCIESSGVHTPFTDPLFLDWTYTSNGQLRILGVPGLTATPTNKYQLTIIAISG